MKGDHKSDTLKRRFRDAGVGGVDVDAKKWRADVAQRLFGGSKKEVRIGRHTVVERVGDGATGVVYAAYDPELDRKVALKLLRPEASAGGRQADAWLAREAKTLARLSHPNVVPVYDVGKHEGQVFITLEFVTGSTLRQWLERPRPQKEIVEVFAQAGRGLAAAHAAGLVHRDFKPDNVLIGEDQRVRVSDFGIARHLDRGGEEVTETDSAVLGTSVSGDKAPATTHQGAGTPAYMAPEQFLGDPVDARTDQFGFCVALHEALYGQRPFPGRDRTKLAANVTAGRRTIPDGVSVPQWLEKIVARGLNPEPTERYPSMEALLSDLTRDRRPRWGRWAVAASLGLGVAGVVVAVEGTNEATSVLCGDPVAAFESVWGKQRAGQVRQAFAATEAPYALDSYARVEAAVDEYGQRWVGAYGQACGDDEGERMLQTVHCLRSRLLELRALGELFIGADAEIVEHAVDGVASLRAPDQCLYSEVVEAAPAGADDAARGELRLAVARARALGDTGKHREGLALAHEGIKRARDLADRALEAEALLVAGELEHMLMSEVEGDPEVTLHAAVLAAEAARRPDLLARALVEQLIARVYSNQRQAARDLEPRARAAVAAVGDPPELAGRLDLAIGDLEAFAGNFELSQAMLTRAIETFRSGDPSNRRWVAKAENLLGEMIFESGRFGESLPHYERMLDITIEELGPNHLWAAKAHGNMAEVFFVAGRYDDAEEHFRLAFEIRRATVGNDSIRVIHSRAHMGDVLLPQGRAAEALTFYTDGLASREKVRPPRPGRDGVLPIVYSDLQADLQEAWLHNGAAWALIELGRLDDALAEAMAVEGDAMPDDIAHPDLTGRLDMRGQVLLAQGRWDEAIEAFSAVIDPMQEHYGRGHAVIAWVLGGLGLAELERGQPRAGIPHLKRALAIRNTAPDAYPRARGDLQFALARALWRAGGDKAVALDLGRRAHDDYARARNRRGGDLGRVEAWLRARE